MLVAAQLYAGPRSAIDGVDACHFHGVSAARPDEDRVYVVEPWGESARTTDFVVVRRTLAPIVSVATDLLRYVEPATAVIAAARRGRLFVESAVVHETNGRVAHNRQDLFEDMQARHDALTASGFVVLHNSPRRVRLHSREVISEVERCHLRHLGRGLPPGVEILRSAA